MPYTGSSLEIFLLAVVERGVASSYDLKNKFDLSVGATIPALKRLEEEELIQREPAEAGARREKRVYGLTPKGRRALRTGVRKLLERKSPATLEGALRIATLPVLAGFDGEAAADYLRRAADDRMAELKQLGTRLEAKVTWDPSNTYAWMLHEVSGYRLRAEAAGLKRVADGVAAMWKKKPRPTR